MQVLQQNALKNTIQILKYIKEIFKRVKLLQQWKLKSFYREEIPN